MPTETTKIVRLIDRLVNLTKKKALRDAIDIYRENGFDELIKEELLLQFDNEIVRKRLRPLVTTELNLCKKVIDDTSMVYKEPAQRMATVGEGETATEDERYKEIVETTHLDLVMKEVNAYTRLVNHVLIRPCVRNGKMEMDIILPDNFEIYTSADDWKDIIAIRYYAGERDVLEQTLVGSGVTSGYTGSCYLWVKKRATFEHDGAHGILEPGTYEYGANESMASWKFEPARYFDKNGEVVLPFVLTYKKYPIDQLLNYTDGQAIVDTSINMAIYLTMMNELMKFQSFKQLVVISDGEIPIKDGQVIDPAQVWKLITAPGGSADVKVLDTTTDLKMLNDVIRERASLFLAQQGIPPSSFTLTNQPQAGIAMKIDRAPLMEIRENDISYYRIFERELFEVTRIVNNTDIPAEPIADNAEFHIDFGEIQFQASPQEDAVTWQTRISNNVATPIDWMRADNPDLDEDEAMAKYLKNKQINAATSVRPTVQPGQPVQDGVQPTKQPGQAPQNPGQPVEDEEDEVEEV